VCRHRSARVHAAHRGAARPGHRAAPRPEAVAEGRTARRRVRYLDDQDRVIVADGDNVLHAVGHVRDASGAWRLTDGVLADLSRLVGADDHVTGLAPGSDGGIWFVTVDAKVGAVRPGDQGSGRVLDLPADAGRPAGERISNGITVRPGGASVMTTHALYEVSLDDEGQPHT